MLYKIRWRCEDCGESWRGSPLHINDWCDESKPRHWCSLCTEKRGLHYPQSAVWLIMEIDLSYGT